MKSRFSLFFCLLMEGSGDGSVQIIKDPNPGGPKTYLSDPDREHYVRAIFSRLSIHSSSLLATSLNDISALQVHTGKLEAVLERLPAPPKTTQWCDRTQFRCPFCCKIYNRYFTFRYVPTCCVLLTDFLYS